ncbi:MAG TPA: DUF4301 family protein [Thermoanaerobaculia bacterium]|nr:DUF4301 family protein [Thermoanaerobaculia bacterium]
MSVFTRRDGEQMEALGISRDEAERQLHLFANPPPPIRLDRPARVGDGILRIAEEERGALEARAATAAEAGELGRFVPASGAASRMFRDLEAARLGETEGAAGEARATFLERLEDFAFFEDLAAALARSGKDLAALRRAGRAEPILEHLLTGAGGAGLGYAELPKGLLRFHRYPQERRTAFEEHLVEAVETSRAADGTCRLHFTVSPEHRDGFERQLAAARELYGRRFDTRFDVTFSHQAHATDTLAVDEDDRPFRLDDGTLLFRPGGHGALLHNLGALGGGVVFVKNIDNVVPDAAKGLVVEWKRLLAGRLLTLRDRAFDLLDRLEGSDDPALVDEAARFLADHLYRTGAVEGEERPTEERRRQVIDLLDRPLRVCGVVENVGEPGGGPFWVREPSGDLSLQIVEASQVAGDDEAQQSILGSSTHFNPVDLVCSLADRHGHPYRLDDYVDPQTVFIAEKSHGGRPLKALERPGLWNGAMAGWNTVFVEVPLATFAPVKTVFDLLRPEHQTGVKPDVP